MKNNSSKQSTFNISELFLIIWIIICLLSWCLLVVIFGIQKLLPNSSALQPIKNITNEQGQWIWPTDWKTYFMVKK